jgi:Fe-S-cluster containining protein
MGFIGNHGGCCTIADRDFIIGPHHDTSDFLDRLSEKLGREILFKEVFLTYEEGKNLFPNKSTFQDKNNFPALKVDLSNPKLPCIFYNTHVRSCMIYDVRPETCSSFECNYLRDQTETSNISNK